MVEGVAKLEGENLLAPKGRRTKQIESASMVSALIAVVTYDFKHAGTAVGVAHEDAAERLARRIIVRGDYKGEALTLYSAVPRDSALLDSLILHESRPQLAPDFAGANPGDVDADRRTEFTLRFSGTGLVDNSVFGLPLGAIRKAQLVTDGALATDLMTGEDEGAGAAEMTVTGTELLERRFLRRRSVASPVFTVDTSDDITQTQDAKRFYLPENLSQGVGGADILRVLLVAEVDGVRSDAVVRNAGLVIDGAPVYEKLPASFYQRENVAAIPHLTDTVPGAILWDFVADGRPDGYKVRTAARPFIDLDVSGVAGSVEVRALVQYVRRSR